MLRDKYVLGVVVYPRTTSPNTHETPVAVEREPHVVGLRVQALNTVLIESQAQMVSIIPGMLMTAPDLTDTSGLVLPPNFPSLFEASYVRPQHLPKAPEAFFLVCSSQRMPW